MTHSMTDQPSTELNPIAQSGALEGSTLDQTQREQANILQMILTNMGEAVVVADENGKFLLFNPAAEKLHGKGPEDVPPEKWSETYGIYLPDGVTLYPPEEAPLVRALYGESVDSAEAYIRNAKTGQKTGVLITARPLVDDHGRSKGGVAVLRNIDERIRAEKFLRESEERYNLVVESVREYAIFTLDPEGRVTSWNRGAQNLLGYTASEIIGKNFAGFYPAEIAKQGYPQQVLKEAVNKGSMEVEAWHVQKSGTKFWANIVITPLYYEDGRLRGFSKVVRDDTLHKQADEAIRRQSAFVRLLQDVAVAANQATDVREAMSYALDQICATTGWSFGHAINSIETNSHRELISFDLWHIDNPERYAAFQAVSRSRQYKEGDGLPGEVFAEGKPVWVRDLRKFRKFHRIKEAKEAGFSTGIGLPVMVGNQVVAVLEFYSEQMLDPDEELMEVMAHIGTQLGRVIERKRSEQALRESELRFRTIIESAPMGIEMVDLDGHLLEANHALRQMLGYEQDEPKNNGRTRIWAPNVVIDTAPFRDLREGKIDAYVVEKTFPKRDGQPVWGRLSVALVRDDEGAPRYAIGMLEDISERKQMESDLAEIRLHQMEGREMERLHLAQDLHDGPIQDLYGLSFHLKAFETELPEGVDTKQIEEMQTNLQQVVRTLRTISGELRPPALTPFGLEKAIHSYGEEFMEAHPEILVHMRLMSDGDKLSEPVRLALYRIFQQTMGNIIRHAEASNVYISLELDEKQVILEVQDDGKGFRVPKRWINLVREGHLGIVGAVERAEAVGGKLTIESASNAGTTVRVIIPLG